MVKDVMESMYTWHLCETTHQGTSQRIVSVRLNQHIHSPVLAHELFCPVTTHQWQLCCPGNAVRSTNCTSNQSSKHKFSPSRAI